MYNQLPNMWIPLLAIVSVAVLILGGLFLGAFVMVIAEHFQEARQELKRRLAAEFRTQITTAEELNALPVGSVLLDQAGKAIQKTKPDGFDADAATLARAGAPFTVVHVPDGKEEKSH